MKLEWRDPPESSGRGRRGRFLPLIAELKKKPGDWAVIATYEKKATAQGTTSSLRNAHNDCEFEWGTSKDETDVFEVFGRAKLHNPPAK